MGAIIKSTEFTDDNVLFATKTSANSWRLSMTVDSMNTVAEGVAKQCVHVADMTSIDGTTILQGTNATDHLTMGTLDFTNDANVKTAFTILAEKINCLTYRLEQAGLMKDTS